VAGAADAFTVVFRGAIVAAVTPDRLRGRVMAADYVIGAGGGQLGNLEAGALGSLTSPVISALSGGLATIAGAVVIGLALPAFTRYRCGPDYPGEDQSAGDDLSAGTTCRPRTTAPPGETGRPPLTPGWPSTVSLPAGDAPANRRGRAGQDESCLRAACHA
jgi:hypothetical protein